jgi:hypothetical protein
MTLHGEASHGTAGYCFISIQQVINTVEIQHFGHLDLELRDRGEESCYVVAEEKDHACKEQTLQSSHDLNYIVVSFRSCYVLRSNVLAYQDYRGYLEAEVWHEEYLACINNDGLNGYGLDGDHGCHECHEFKAP